MKRDYSIIDYKLAYADLYTEVARMLVSIPPEGKTRQEILAEWDTLRSTFPRTKC